ncbi:MAG: anti-sigma factor [Caldimonas sp.]
MDYGRSDLADALAAEYVLGTLRGGARRRFEALLPAHSELHQATLAWHERLMPLTGVLAPVQPSSEVWRRISDRLDRRKDARAGSAWQRLAFWRGLTAFATVAAIGLAVLLANPSPVPPPIVVVLAATSAAPSGVSAAAIVASISGDGATLVTRAITPVAVRPDRSLELWAIPAGGAPRSLGLLPVGSGTVALRGKVLAGAETLAVTVEPTGGSPSGKPTGPIVYSGKFSL